MSALHSYFPRAAHVTVALLNPFAWLDRQMPPVRQHGYVLASVGVRLLHNVVVCAVWPSLSFITLWSTLGAGWRRGLERGLVLEDDLPRAAKPLE